MQSRDSIADIWGERTPYEGQDRWPVRVDQRTLEEPEHWVQSACVLCSNGCGCDVIEQAARSLHDKDFEAAIGRIRHQNGRQLAWLHGRIRQAAPQTLVVPS